MANAPNWVNCSGANRWQVALMAHLQRTAGPLGCLGASSESCDESVVVGVRSDRKLHGVITFEQTDRTVSAGNAG